MLQAAWSNNSLPQALTYFLKVASDGECLPVAIPHELPYLTGFVIHCEIVEEAMAD